MKNMTYSVYHIKERKIEKEKPGAERHFKLDLKDRFIMILASLSPLHYLHVICFLFDLDQSNICRDIQKIEQLVRKCVPIPQKLYNKTKRLRTTEEVEKYFPGFLAFTDCTEQQIPRPMDDNKRKIFYTN